MMYSTVQLKRVGGEGKLYEKEREFTLPGEFSFTFFHRSFHQFSRESLEN